MGQLCCGVARAFGARKIVVADVVPSRLEFATQKGATHTYQMEQTQPRENAASILANIEEKRGSDVVIDPWGFIFASPQSDAYKQSWCAIMNSLDHHIGGSSLHA